MRRSAVLRWIISAVASGVAGAAIASCGGDSPTTPTQSNETVQVTVTIVDPGNLTLDAIGATLQLTATVTTTGTRAPSVKWGSSNTSVALVSDEGLVTALGNGTTKITARAGTASAAVDVAVDQVPSALVLLETPLNSAVGLLFRVTVVLLDRLGQLSTDATDSIRVVLGNNPSGGLLGGSTTVVPDTGFAEFLLTLDSPESGYTLQILAPFDTVTSSPFDVAGAPDRVRFHNAGGAQIGALFDGNNQVFQNDFGRVLTDSVVQMVFDSSVTSNEITAFTQGRPPVLLNPAMWTDAADTIDVTFPPVIRIPVTVWIVRGPFDFQRDHAVTQSVITAAVWSVERMGVEFESFDIVDATNDPDAPSLFNTTTCQQKSLAESAIGKVAGRINLYYVSTVDGGTDRGYTCAGGDVIFMAEFSGQELLVHEIGHSFGLGHVDNLTGYDRTNVMHSASNTREYFTEGQVFRAHFNSFTALNQLYGVVPSEVRTCPESFADVTCLALILRLWPDGRFPANAGLRP